MQALDLRNLVGEYTVRVHRTRQILALLDDLVRETDAVIVLSECRSLVDDTCAGIVCHVRIRQYAEVLLAALAVGEVPEHGLVLLAHQLAPLKGRLDLERLGGLLGRPLLLLRHFGIDLGQPSLREDVPRPGLLVEDPDVLHRGMHAQRDVAGQRPRGRRPRHEAHALLVPQGEAHHDGRIAHVLVVQARLEVAEGGAARRAERHDLVTLVHEVLVEQLLEDPPDALHERRVHRLVVVLEVDPPPQSIDGPLPLLGVPRDDAAARLVVLVDSHLQHLIAVRDVELLVDLVLDGEAVAVPPRAALDVVPGLAGVARHDVLDGPGEDVAVVGQTGGERRAVVEGVLLKDKRA